MQKRSHSGGYPAGSAAASFASRPGTMSRTPSHDQVHTQRIIGSWEDKRNQSIQRLMTALAGDVTVKELNLTDLHLRGEQLKHLADALAKNKTLQTLVLGSSFGGSNLGVDGGAGFFAQGLAANTSLQLLQLQKCELSDPGVKDLVRSLVHNRTLRSLDLTWNHLGDKSALYLAELLKVNVSLHTLILHKNGIKSRGAQCLADALFHNSTLKTLSLSGNLIDHEGATFLSSALQTNSTLQSLDLSGNEVGEAGVRFLAGLLKFNNNLMSLNLCKNRIGNGGASLLAEALKVNKGLHILDIAENHIDSDGAAFLASAIKVNTTLQSLNLSGNNIAKIGAQQLAEALVVQWEKMNVMFLKFLEVQVVGTTDLARIGKLEQLPDDVCTDGLATVHKYLRSLGFSTSTRRRIKTLVVGSENVGKTTLVDVLQPLRGYLSVLWFGLMGVKTWVELQGRCLRLQRTHEATDSAKSIVLSRDWTLKRHGEGDLRLTLVPPATATDASSITLTFTADSSPSMLEWIDRLGHILHNSATHGIDVRRFVLTDTVFNDKQGHDTIEMIAWDFAGQQSYYTSHHHFMTGAAIYLVVWDVSKQGKHEHEHDSDLVFWLRSLKARLPPPKPEDTPRTAVVVVGTHIDMPNVDNSPQGIEERRIFLNDLAERVGLRYPIHIMELSCVDMRGVDDLLSYLWTQALLLCGAGEIVPRMFSVVEKTIDVLTADGRLTAQLPLVRLEDVMHTYDRINPDPKRLPLDVEQLKSCLSHLYRWGRIVYLAESATLADVVVLSPTFLTQDALGELFRPTHTWHTHTGRLTLEELSQIWNNDAYSQFQGELVELLQKFDLCFADLGATLVFPATLAAITAADADAQWAKSCAANHGHTDEGGPVVERIYAMDGFPPELAWRLLCRLHPHLGDSGQIWRNAAVLSLPPVSLAEPDQHVLATAVLFAHSTATSVKQGEARGRIVVRVRARNPTGEEALWAQKELLARLAREIESCIRMYPGIVYNELFRCPQCPPPPQQSQEMDGSVAAEGCLTPLASAVNSLVDGTGIVRCTGQGKSISVADVLVRAGLMDAYPLHAHVPPLRQLRFSQTILPTLVDASADVAPSAFDDDLPLARVLSAQVERPYPSLFLLAPPPSSNATGGTVGGSIFDVIMGLDQFRVLPVCEAHVNGTFYPHATSGSTLKDVTVLRRQTDLVRKLAALSRQVCHIMSDTAVELKSSKSVRLLDELAALLVDPTSSSAVESAPPTPSSTTAPPSLSASASSSSSSRSNLSTAVTDFAASALAEFDSSAVQGMLSPTKGSVTIASTSGMSAAMRLPRLGSSLVADLEQLFGLNLNGTVRGAGVQRHVVLHGGGPFGAESGACLWLCPEHGRLLGAWNDEASPSRRSDRSASLAAEAVSVSSQSWASSQLWASPISHE